MNHSVVTVPNFYVLILTSRADSW